MFSERKKHWKVRYIKRQTKNLNFCDGCGLITSPNPNLKKKFFLRLEVGRNVSFKNHLKVFLKFKKLKNIEKPK